MKTTKNKIKVNKIRFKWQARKIYNMKFDSIVFDISEATQIERKQNKYNQWQTVFLVETLFEILFERRFEYKRKVKISLK